MDWKLLKYGCRQSVTCDDSDDEDSFDPDKTVAGDRQQEAEQPNDSGDTEQRWAICDRPQRKTTSTKYTEYKEFICD